MANGQPPFVIPNNIKNGSSYRWVEKRIPDTSDGTQSLWPAQPPYRSSSTSYYLCYLAQEWAKTQGTIPPGIHYYLDRLPNGYTMFEIDQPGGDQTYKRLFGHPSGRFYDSAPTFTPHFLWLISGMTGTCECKKCTPKSKAFIPRPRARLEVTGLNPVLLNRSTARKDSDDDDSSRSHSADGLANRRTQRQVKAIGAPYATDEEGTEDIYKDCVRKLLMQKGSNQGIEIDLTEDNSIDWKAEREPLQRHLAQIERQHTFVPRVGELVLWCPLFPDGSHVMRNPATGEYKFYSFKDKIFHGFPAWRGGIIAAVPTETTKNGLLDFSDVLDTPDKRTMLNTAGFRVETMPDPNDDLDKSLSKQYKYVALRNIRPLSQWQMLLKGVSIKKLHPSVLYALTCMTTISLAEKWRFIGDWPLGRLFCKAMYIGSELITIGDTVRLLKPNEDEMDMAASCTDVMIVSSIRYNLIDMQPDHAAANTPQLSDKSYVSLVGQAYTTDARRAFGAPFDDDAQQTNKAGPPPVPHEEIKSLFGSVGADEYGPWYALHGPKERFEASHEQILGKLYEADAVRLWTGQRQQHPEDHASFKPSLDFDARSILAGRKYATAADARLPEPTSPSDLNWLLADTRAEALAIASLNGLEVGKYHSIRDAATLRHWRAQVKLSDGREIGAELQQELTDATTRNHNRAPIDVNRRRGRPPGTRIINGKAYYAGEIIPDDVMSSSTADDEAGKYKYKSSSQAMIDAGLNSDSDESSVNHDHDDENTVTVSRNAEVPLRSIEPPHHQSSIKKHASSIPTYAQKPTTTNASLPRDRQPGNTTSSTQATKKSFSKADIMSSLDAANNAMALDDNGDDGYGYGYDGQDSDSDSDSDSDDALDFLNQPVVIRGGTEESEGGDYRGD